jgi:glycine/D-amino acid oxidase-like deaminating enzyme
MARTDAIVLGAGIVGVSVALHLAKRGLAVALVDRGEPGQGTSYLFPASFPSSLSALIRVALKRAPEADYHIGFLAKVAPWLLAFRRNSSPEHLVETMQAMRPLFSRAVSEHEALMAEAGAERYMRHTGWLKLYRSDKGLAGTARERAVAAELGMPLRVLDPEAARAPAFRHGVPPRRILGAGGKHLQSARGDPGLCGTVQDARRCRGYGRCAASASDGRPLPTPGRPPCAGGLRERRRQVAGDTGQARSAEASGGPGSAARGRGGNGAGSLGDERAGLCRRPGGQAAGDPEEATRSLRFGSDGTHRADQQTKSKP